MIPAVQEFGREPEPEPESVSLEALDRRLRVIESLLGIASGGQMPMPVAPPAPVTSVMQGMPSGGGMTPPFMRRG